MMEKKTITFEHRVSPLSQSLPSTHDRCSEQTADHKHFTHSTLAVHFLLALIRPQKFNPKSQVFPSIFLRQSVVDLFKWKKKKEEKKADALFQLDVVLLQSDTAHVTVKGVIIKKKSVALSLFSIAYCCTATLDS